MPKKKLKTSRKIILASVIVSLALITGLYFVYPYLSYFFPATNSAEPSEYTLVLDLIAEGFTSPVALEYSGDGRLFIVDRVGIIYIIDANGNMMETPFFDIRDKIVELRTNFDERGLLGFALHPDFENNGKFYVYYSAQLRESAPEGWDSTIHLSEFLVSENPNIADENSERILLEIDEPQFNHNGGSILFGPDRYLYIGIGDWGGANDNGEGHGEIGNGQNITSLLGKILRIDVNGNPYAIPQDNPFVGREGRDEIYAFGFRNPFSFSFDSGGYLFVADVGQNLWEVVNLVQNGGNYGWRVREGTHCFDYNNPNTSPETCSETDIYGNAFINPIIEYKNARNGGIGTSVIGGYIYEGSLLTGIQGQYIFGDWSSSFAVPDGRLYIANPSDMALWDFEELKVSGNTNQTGSRLNEVILSIGKDAENELYLLTSSAIAPVGATGKVYKITGVQ
ncbi:MAG: PQQ-dependent sugar dehydrogenase [Candidatus Nanoarchaeia archaeon]|nr:PQQ-dependent sugar dehydrogenase [Candidatus Nanoarchaeia archaeon]